MTKSNCGKSGGSSVAAESGLANTIGLIAAIAHAPSRMTRRMERRIVVSARNSSSTRTALRIAESLSPRESNSWLRARAAVATALAAPRA